MKSYDTFIFRITRDTLYLEDDESIIPITSVPKRTQIMVTITDKDIAQGNAVQKAFEMAMEEYLKNPDTF